MRNLISCIALLSFTTICFAQEFDLAKAIKPGTRLSYTYDCGGDEPCEFIVIIKEKNGTSFKWEIDNKRSGSIQQNAKALLNAQALFFPTGKGAKKLDDKTTSMWLSMKVFNHFQKNFKMPIKVYMNGLKKPAYDMGTHRATGEHTIYVNGKEKKIREEVAEELVKEGTLYIRKDNAYYISYYPDKNFPIILRMNGEFTIELTSVKTK